MTSGSLTSTESHTTLAPWCLWKLPRTEPSSRSKDLRSCRRTRVAWCGVVQRREWASGSASERVTLNARQC